VMGIEPVTEGLGSVRSHQSDSWVWLLFDLGLVRFGQCWGLGSVWFSSVTDRYAFANNQGVATL